MLRTIGMCVWLGIFHFSFSATAADIAIAEELDERLITASECSINQKLALLALCVGVPTIYFANHGYYITPDLEFSAELMTVLGLAEILCKGPSTLLNWLNSYDQEKED